VSQTVTVHDNTAPSLVGVPSDTTAQCNEVPTAPTVSATDACDASPSVAMTESSTQNADATLCGHYCYTITRTWTATDACANHSSGTQVITVVDTPKPVLAGLGANTTINCLATPSFTAPTASDNCDANATITFTDATTAGSCAGNYSVTRT